jgi:hypothetical protein
MHWPLILTGLREQGTGWDLLNSTCMSPTLYKPPRVRQFPKTKLLAKQTTLRLIHGLLPDSRIQANMRFETLFVAAALLLSGAEAAIRCWHVDGHSWCAEKCGGNGYLNCAASRVCFPPLLLMAGWAAEANQYVNA